MKTYRIGLLGAGFMGRTHSWCWQSLPYFYSGLPFRVELAAVATSRPETAERARAELGYARVHADAEALVADPEIDIVDIATPNHLHRDALLGALRHGKAVYCDKPLTGDIASALAIEAAVAGTDTSRVQMVFHNRFFPATLRAKQIIESGTLGEPVSFRLEYLHSGNVPEGKRLAWKDRRDFGAGVLYDLGSHAVDLLTWLCDRPIVDVFARQKTLHPLRPSLEDPSVLVEQDSDDMTLMNVVLAGGAIGTIEASKIATGAQDELRFEIHGTRGAVRFNLMDPNYLDWFDLADPETPHGGFSGFQRIHCVQRYEPPAMFPAPKATVGWLRGHLHSIYSFVDALHEGRPCEPSLARGIEIEKVLAAVAESASQGRRVEIPR